MTVRDTSIEAFKEILESGELGEMQRIVYEHLYMHGPCTASELFHFMSQAKRNPTHSNITTRLGELRDSGAVKECGKRECQVTGRKVLTWDVTMDMPVKTRKLSKAEKKEQILSELRDLYSKINGKELKASITRIANKIKGM